MEHVRNHRNIRLVTTDKRCQLVSETNYHITKRFSEDMIAIEMKKAEIKMNKPIYLGLVRLLCMNFGMIILNQSMIII